MQLLILVISGSRPNNKCSITPAAEWDTIHNDEFLEEYEEYAQKVVEGYRWIDERVREIDENTFAKAIKKSGKMSWCCMSIDTAAIQTH